MRTEDANMNRALWFYIYIIPTYFCTYNLTFLTVFFDLLVFLVMFSYQIHVDLGTVAINEAYKYYTNTCHQTNFNGVPWEIYSSIVVLPKFNQV